MLTIKDKLLCGIEYPAGSGQMHRDFEVRLPRVGDRIEVAESPDVMGSMVSNARFDAAMLTRCITSLGTIPPEKITEELIVSAVEIDYQIMEAAQERLKKSLIVSNQIPESESIDSQSSSSESTE
ncbi:hypothetical protein PAN31117_04676 [Pandoraea anapnoica]|uniref:Phage tail assembly protein n=1 Tax=Pandoraea anapnoica TaxID=2508301 RepID=A0A5E5AML5_9BURK|nr:MULTISPECIES: hypothetical protein [Pandoraea]VVE14692.1 hypothetical protein PIN31009_02814 [Pandoraea iniqua]VVE73330.1 hypothetical protein PAN31117_04676 [Pandoraea anapnoica]